MALQLLDHGHDAVMATHPKIVALGDVMGEHDLGVGADARQDCQQHVSLQRLRLVDDDERVMQ